MIMKKPPHQLCSRYPIVKRMITNKGKVISIYLYRSPVNALPPPPPIIPGLD